MRAWETVREYAAASHAPAICWCRSVRSRTRRVTSNRRRPSTVRVCWPPWPRARLRARALPRETRARDRSIRLLWRRKTRSSCSTRCCRSETLQCCRANLRRHGPASTRPCPTRRTRAPKSVSRTRVVRRSRSEEHTSELQSQSNLVCRLLLEKKKKTPHYTFLSQSVYTMPDSDPPIYGIARGIRNDRSIPPLDYALQHEARSHVCVMQRSTS